MRLFHFICEKYGLDDIRRRRLKISRIQDLNDPFELLSIELSNKHLRELFQRVKEQISRHQGILCFSKKSSNPVQWSHYADNHRGLCLGFDVADDLLLPVSYAAKRMLTDVDRLLKTGRWNQSAMDKLLRTKFAHWRYEDEVRSFVTLDTQDPESGFYFADFSEKLKLVQVIVGARSDLSRKELADALGDLAKDVTVFRARLAFKSFKVLRNRNESLWS